MKAEDLVQRVLNCESLQKMKKKFVGRKIQCKKIRGTLKPFHFESQCE